MQKVQFNKRTVRYLWIPAGVVMFCMLVVYALHGIFPFGTESVVFDDMGQCSVPIFYAVRDALHGDGDLLYNLRTAGGVFISGVYEGSFSLFNIVFFMLCPREKILESMSFFLMFKMMIASVTAMALLRSKFRMHPFWQILLSVLYAFNPFLLQYYSNASWLEIVMLAPLVFLGADKLLTEKKVALYIFTLAYSLILQLYISYMVVLFLFLDGALYIGLLLPKEERKEAAVRFGFSTVFALALSAFSALPSYFYMTSTSRFRNTKGYADIIMSTAGNNGPKIGMLLVLTAIPLALTAILAFQIRKRTKVVLYFGCSLALFILPILFENINLLWHMGSYIRFSMRYAFLFHLMLLCSAGYVLSALPQSLFLGARKVKILSALCAVGIAGAAVAVMSRLFQAAGKGVVYQKNVYMVFAAFLLSFMFYFLVLRFGTKAVSCVLLSCFLFTEIMVYMGRAVTTGSARNFEYSLDFIEECDTIHATLPIENNGVYRIKNIDGTLNSNYPLIIGFPSMSNFTHTIPYTIKQTMLRLGYSAVYTRILDTGGTLFSDALLGCRYALSMQKLPSDDYTFRGTAGRYMVYESDYALPFGTICSGDIVSDSLFSKYAFDTLNSIWHTVSDSPRDLFDKPQVKKEIQNRTVAYDLDVDGTKEVYLVLSGMNKRKNVRIYVNGGVVPIPTLGEPANTLYTTRFNNSLLDLGEFTDTHLTIRVDLINAALQPEKLQMRVAALDKALLADYCAQAKDSVQTKKQGCSFRIRAESTQEGKMLFLPVTYDSAIRCRVNGKQTPIERALGTFIAIPLESGTNEITVTFLPKGFLPGAAVSAAALLLCIVWIIHQKRIVQRIAPGRFGSFVLVAYYGADAAALTAMYIVPIVCKFYTMLAGG